MAWSHEACVAGGEASNWGNRHNGHDPIREGGHGWPWDPPRWDPTRRIWDWRYPYYRTPEEKEEDRRRYREKLERDERRERHRHDEDRRRLPA